MNTAKYTLEDKLAYAQHKADQARERLAAGEKRREAARDLGGGLLSFGGSGSQRARRQVQSATERATNAVGEALAAIKYWDGKVSGYERRIVERDRALLTRDDVAGATHVRTRSGWHKVVRVNAKSTTVKSTSTWRPLCRILTGCGRACITLRTRSRTPSTRCRICAFRRDCQTVEIESFMYRVSPPRLVLAAGTGQHPREVSTMRTVPVKRGIRTHRRRRAGLWRWGHSVPKHVRLGLPGPTFDA